MRQSRVKSMENLLVIMFIILHTCIEYMEMRKSINNIEKFDLFKAFKFELTSPLKQNASETVS